MSENPPSMANPGSLPESSLEYSEDIQRVYAPHFTAEQGKYTSKTVVGTLLTLLTLGIYRAWFTTNLRRYLWANTHFDGDSFEYHGRGIELLIGFLIAIVLFLPLFVGPQLLALFLGQIGTQYFAILGVYYLIILLFSNFAIYRGRAYRLSRTSWRGIRFRQTGSDWHYAFISFVWMIVTILTLGITYPWMRAWQLKYRINNSWFGNQQASTTGSAGKFAKYYFVGYGICLLITILIFSSADFYTNIKYFMHSDSVIETLTPFSSAIAIIATFFFSITLYLYFGLPYLFSREFNVFAGGVNIGEATASIRIKARVIYLYFLLYAVILIVGGYILALVFNGLISASMMGMRNPGMIGAGLSAGAVASIVILYLVFIVFSTTIYAAFFRFPIMRHMLDNIVVHNHHSVVAKAESDTQTSGLSEGIGDALDFDFGY